MTPLDFLRAYRSDRRVLCDDDVAPSPLKVEEGDRVGVVLLNLGGPRSLDEIESFLYQLLMDPAFLDVPLGTWPRHLMAKGIAYYRAKRLREKYKMIGGGSPLNRLVGEQATVLQRHLNRTVGSAASVDFRTYPAMRYSSPYMGDVGNAMVEDDVDRVVLLPQYPQYSTFLTRSALAYWDMLAETGAVPEWPTTAVPEYAANPKYVRALSERIDEALQRFPRDVREDATLVFSAPGTPFQETGDRQDRYCCHLRSTVGQVMETRGYDRPAHVAYQSLIGPNHWLRPSTLDTIETLVDQGRDSILVIPTGFVTDHVNVSYELDVEVRKEVEAYGVNHFEVTAGLNTHQLFIEALAEATISQLLLPGKEVAARVGGDGQRREYSLEPLETLPRHTVEENRTGSSHCDDGLGARQWGSSSETGSPGVRPAGVEREDDPSEPAQAPRPSSTA